MREEVLVFEDLAGDFDFFEGDFLGIGKIRFYFLIYIKFVLRVKFREFWGGRQYNVLERFSDDIFRRFL